MNSNIPHDSTVEAQVNAPQLVTLYAADGEPIQVQADRVESWLRRGYTREKFDLDTLISDLTAQAANLAAPWRDYAAACQAAGTIDSAAQETARHALDLFAQACNRLHLALHATYPTAETGQEEPQ